MTDATTARTYRTHQLVTAALAAVCFFASAPGQSFLISVFVDDLLDDTGLSRTTFSVLYAAGTIVSAASMLVLGRVIDRRGLRTAWIVVAVALAAACGLASLVVGAVTAFLALALLRTFGQGSFTLVGTLLVARSFERRRGQAMAVANLGLTAASVILPPAIAASILALGWRQSYQILGLVLLIVIVPLAVLVRTGPPRPGTVSGGPIRDDVYPPATRRPRRLRFAIPTRTSARMLVALAAAPLIGTALTFHAVSILDTRGLTFLQAGLALSVLGITSALGTVAYGTLADRLSTRWLLTLLNLTVLAGTLLLLVPQPVTAYASFGVLGLAMGGTGVANGTVWARTFGLAQLGKIQGMAQSSMITAAAMAPMVPAVAHTVAGTYLPGLAALAAFASLTSMVAVRI